MVGILEGKMSQKEDVIIKALNFLIDKQECEKETPPFNEHNKQDWENSIMHFPHSMTCKKCELKEMLKELNETEREK